MDLATLKEFESVVQTQVPDFEVKFKDKSLWQRLLGFLSHPFNSDYMSAYTTTVYPSVYFPSQDYYETRPKSFPVLAHEFVHLVDAKSSPLGFKLGYMFPQLLGFLPWIAYVVLAKEASWIPVALMLSYLLGSILSYLSKPLAWVWLGAAIIAAGVVSVLFSGWYSAAFFAGLACFAPFPSSMRTKSELRGYTMNLAYTYWTVGILPEILKLSVKHQFISSNYYFMSWSGSSIDERLSEICSDIQSGELQKEYPYSVVYDFLKTKGLIKNE